MVDKGMVMMHIEKRILDKVGVEVILQGNCE